MFVGQHEKDWTSESATPGIFLPAPEYNDQETAEWVHVSIHGTYNNVDLLEFDSWSEDLIGFTKARLKHSFISGDRRPLRLHQHLPCSAFSYSLSFFSELSDQQKEQRLLCLPSRTSTIL
ncbi:unnamed protein product [Pleuronectes platessa]|uniref:Uncharacterized protein n=1 Tax=Pleuronectes platessa TaxID=8262 RepID=A0A9N7TTI0_PLEPL|nr:unnamed protein product [Pleuronectes platessa]